MLYWTESKENQTALQEVHNRIDSLSTSLINGDLLNQPNNEMLAKEYARLTGEIQGLLFLEKVIVEAKQLEEENRDR